MGKSGILTDLRLFSGVNFGILDFWRGKEPSRLKKRPIKKEVLFLPYLCILSVKSIENLCLTPAYFQVK